MLTSQMAQFVFLESCNCVVQKSKEIGQNVERTVWYVFSWSKFCCFWVIVLFVPLSTDVY